MKSSVKNFVDRGALEVSTAYYKAGIGMEKPTALVSLTQRSAGMTFQHSMLSHQARELAQLLLQAADAADIDAAGYAEEPA